MQGFNVIILWKEPQAFLCNISIPTNPGNSCTITQQKELQHHIFVVHTMTYSDLNFFMRKNKGQLFFCVCVCVTPPPLQYLSSCYSSTERSIWDEVPPKIIEKKKEMGLEDS